MIPPPPPPPALLPRRHRHLLRALAPLVPAAHRADWLRLWSAELWCLHHATPRAATHRRRPQTLLPGLVRDALWLRSDALRAHLAGTAALSLLTLALLVALAALPAVLPARAWHGLGPWLAHQGTRFTLESLLLVFVGYSTAAADIVHTAPAPRRRLRTHLVHLRAHLFQAGQIALLLLLAFLLSADLAFPWQPFLPLSADILQTTLFAVFALFGLRWSFLDRGGRCQHCLRSLAGPSRVGRPSHNFLEWNGTELLCRDGHGRLSIPEIETSWCRASAWIPLTPRS